MYAKEVWIPHPFAVEVREVDLAPPARDQVLVRHSVSGISAGSELLSYRGVLPESLDYDVQLDPHAGSGAYPMRTGYAAVGTVEVIGDRVDNAWLGRRVFGFSPHCSHAVCSPEQLISLDDQITDDEAAFIPNLETAIGIVMDGNPRLGERVVVLGQGVVGLLVTRLLARFPLSSLIAVDRIAARREQALTSGADLAIDPDSESDRKRMFTELDDGSTTSGADLVFDVTGNPAALNEAISLAGYGGRIVVGSWYGGKQAKLDLGGKFHRHRISIVSSQVSTIAPDLSARWTKARRMGEVTRLVSRLGVAELVTDRFPIERASDAFAMLDQSPERAMQVLITYDDIN